MSQPYYGRDTFSRGSLAKKRRCEKATLSLTVLVTRRLLRLPCPVRLGWFNTRRNARSIPAQWHITRTKIFMAEYTVRRMQWSMVGRIDAGGDGVSIFLYPLPTRKSPAS
jgi:hypothetical protein